MVHNVHIVWRQTLFTSKFHDVARIFTSKFWCTLNIFVDVLGRHFCFVKHRKIDLKECFVQNTFRPAAKKSLLFPVTRGSGLVKTSEFFFSNAEPFLGLQAVTKGMRHRKIIRLTWHTDIDTHSKGCVSFRTTKSNPNWVDVQNVWNYELWSKTFLNGGQITDASFINKLHPVFRNLSMRTTCNLSGFIYIRCNAFSHERGCCNQEVVQMNRFAHVQVADCSFKLQKKFLLNRGLIMTRIFVLQSWNS